MQIYTQTARSRKLVRYVFGSECCSDVRYTESQLDRIDKTTDSQKDLHTARLEVDFLNKQVAKLQKELHVANNKLQTATFEVDMLNQQIAKLTAENHNLLKVAANVAQPSSASNASNRRLLDGTCDVAPNEKVRLYHVMQIASCQYSYYADYARA